MVDKKFFQNQSLYTDNVPSGLVELEGEEREGAEGGGREREELLLQVEEHRLQRCQEIGERQRDRE